MLEIFHKTIKEGKPTLLNEFRTGSWVVLEEPTPAEVAQVVEMLKLEPDLMNDARDPYEVPRIEKEDGVIYIFTRIPYDEPELKGVVTYPTLIAIGDKFVLTLFQKRTAFMEKMRFGTVDYATTQKAKLFFQIISEINADYGRFMVAINKGVRKATVDFRKISTRDIINFLRFESTLNDFLSALVPTNTLLNQLLNGKYITLYESDKDLIEDNLHANSQLIESSKSNLKNIVNIRDAYSTIMTNNLNRVIRILTALTIILTVPTMISSFFGMNVPLPFADSPVAFIGILFVTVALVGGLIYLFVRNKWL